MANTYSAIYIHLVFAVKFRRAQLSPENSDEIFAYIAGIINNTPYHKSIIVGGVMDHVHILFRMPTNGNIPELAKNIKVSTNKFINDKELVKFHNFSWQEGYGAFSVSPTQTDAVKEYIANQAQHHLQMSFHDEYKHLLTKNRVRFEDAYLFRELE